MTTKPRKDRGGAWYYQFQLAGRRYAAACIHPDTGQPAANKREADKIEALIKAQILLRAGEEPPPQIYTLGMAFSAFGTRKSAGDNWSNQVGYIREMLGFFGPETAVAEISEQRVWDYIAFARAQPIMVYIGGSRVPKEKRHDAAYWRPEKSGRLRQDATINRYLDCLRETLRIAYRLRDGRGKPIVPGEMPKVPELAEPEHLPRPIIDADIDRIVVEAPMHLAEGVLLARLMGFRKGEVFGLTVDQVDLANRGIWLEASSTKANRAEFVPASAEACELLWWLVEQAKQRDVCHLITYPFKRSGTPGRRQRRYVGSYVADGKRHLVRETVNLVVEWRPIKDPRSAWRTILKKLGLDGQHVFHNTKASFVTAVANNATTEVTQQLARHKDYRTTQRYIKISDEIARAAVEAASIRTTVVASGYNRDLQPALKTAGAASFESDPNALENLGFSMVGAAGFEPTTPSPPD